MADRQDKTRGSYASGTTAGQGLPSNNYIPQHRGPGARVDRAQETYEPSRHRPRVVLPHGTVSRDGAHAEPEHSLTSRVLVYGGAAIAAAALTAGAVLAVGTVVDIVSGNDEIDRDADRAADRARDAVYDRASGRNAPRFAAMDERERAGMRSRASVRLRQDEAERARIRSRATETFGPRGNDPSGEDRPRPPRPEGDRPHREQGRHERPAHMRSRRPRPPHESGLGFLGDIEHSGKNIAQSITGIMQAVTAAMEGFRQVAGQAEGVVREFSNTADNIRGFLDAGRGGEGQQDDRPFRSKQPFRRPARRDIVDLRDNGSDDDSARTHRL